MSIRNIKVEATQDRPTSFFAQAMRPAYELCKAETGM